METQDMLWDQRAFELDGEVHTVNFYCYKWEDTTERILNDRYNDPADLEPRVHYGITHDCFFQCECYCIYPSVNPKCPSEEFTENECPLKKTYSEE